MSPEPLRLHSSYSCVCLRPSCPCPQPWPLETTLFLRVGLFFQMPPVSDSMWHLSFRGTYLSQRNAFDVHPRRRTKRGSLLPPGCGSFGYRPRSDQPPADGRAGGSVSPLLGRPQGARRTESGGPDVTLVGQTPSRVSGAARRSDYQFRGTPVPLTLRPPRPRRRPHARPRGPRRPPRGAGSPAGCFWGHRGHSCFVSLPSPPPPRDWGGPLTPCASFAGFVISVCGAPAAPAARPRTRPGDTSRAPLCTVSSPRRHASVAPSHAQRTPSSAGAGGADPPLAKAPRERRGHPHARCPTADTQARASREAPSLRQAGPQPLSGPRASGHAVHTPPPRARLEPSPLHRGLPCGAQDENVGRGPQPQPSPRALAFGVRPHLLGLGGALRPDALQGHWSGRLRRRLVWEASSESSSLRVQPQTCHAGPPGPSLVSAPPRPPESRPAS